eukprot:6200816-Pleurochrysis_carterae.AAC.3
MATTVANRRLCLSTRPQTRCVTLLCLRHALVKRWLHHFDHKIALCLQSFRGARTARRYHISKGSLCDMETSWRGVHVVLAYHTIYHSLQLSIDQQQSLPALTSSIPALPVPSSP